ncbi:MAG: hypothetical protein Q4D56_12825 [Bacteroides sp.]|nr:hypothetical protein [Bacteroides sp.]
MAKSKNIGEYSVLYCRTDHDDDTSSDFYSLNFSNFGAVEYLTLPELQRLAEFLTWYVAEEEKRLKQEEDLASILK